MEKDKSKASKENANIFSKEHERILADRIEIAFNNFSKEEIKDFNSRQASKYTALKATLKEFFQKNSKNDLGGFRLKYNNGKVEIYSELNPEVEPYTFKL